MCGSFFFRSQCTTGCSKKQSYTVSMHLLMLVPTAVPPIDQPNYYRVQQKTKLYSLNASIDTSTNSCTTYGSTKLLQGAAKKQSYTVSTVNTNTTESRQIGKMCTQTKSHSQDLWLGGADFSIAMVRDGGEGRRVEGKYSLSGVTGAEISRLDVLPVTNQC